MLRWLYETSTCFHYAFRLFTFEKKTWTKHLNCTLVLPQMSYDEKIFWLLLLVEHITIKCWSLFKFFFFILSFHKTQKARCRKMWIKQSWISTNDIASDEWPRFQWLRGEGKIKIKTRTEKTAKSFSIQKFLSV